MMTDASSRKPGRPKGSSRYKDSDAQAIRTISDNLFAHPNLTTRAAICQYLGSDNPAPLRRLQTKMKHRDALIDEARQRALAKERQQEQAKQGFVDVVTTLGAIGVVTKDVMGHLAHGIINSPDAIKGFAAMDAWSRSPACESLMRTLGVVTDLRARLAGPQVLQHLDLIIGRNFKQAEGIETALRLGRQLRNPLDPK